MHINHIIPFNYLFHFESSAVACRHLFFFEMPMNKLTGIVLKSSFWGEQVKKSSIFAVDFVVHRKQFSSWQYPNIGLIKLGGGRGGLRSC